MLRFRFSLGLLLAILVVACSIADPEADQLEARIAALEERVAELDADSVSGRSLQESQAAQTGVEGTEADSGPSTAGGLAQRDLLDLAESELADAAFFGEDDPEFGGVTVAGDESAATIRLYRAGLENRELLLELVVSLGFGDDVLEGIQSIESTGRGSSEDASYEAVWTTSPEEVVLELRRI